MPTIRKALFALVSKQAISIISPHRIHGVWLREWSKVITNQIAETVQEDGFSRGSPSLSLGPRKAKGFLRLLAQRRPATGR